MTYVLSREQTHIQKAHPISTKDTRVPTCKIMLLFGVAACHRTRAKSPSLPVIARLSMSTSKYDRHKTGMGFMWMCLDGRVDLKDESPKR